MIFYINIKKGEKWQKKNMEESVRELAERWGRTAQR